MIPKWVKSYNSIPTHIIMDLNQKIFFNVCCVNQIVVFCFPRTFSLNSFYERSIIGRCLHNKFNLSHFDHLGFFHTHVRLGHGQCRPVNYIEGPTIPTYYSRKITCTYTIVGMQCTYNKTTLFINKKLNNETCGLIPAYGMSMYIPIIYIRVNNHLERIIAWPKI